MRGKPRWTLDDLSIGRLRSASAFFVIEVYKSDAGSIFTSRRRLKNMTYWVIT